MMSAATLVTAPEFDGTYYRSGSLRQIPWFVCKGVVACLCDMPPLPEHAEPYVPQCRWARCCLTRTAALERTSAVTQRRRLCDN
jgi:hypothetical protein